jgi:hypothetical protein
MRDAKVAKLKVNEMRGKVMEQQATINPSNQGKVSQLNRNLRNSKKNAEAAELKVKELCRRVMEEKATIISPLYEGKEIMLREGNIFNLHARAEANRIGKEALLAYRRKANANKLERRRVAVELASQEEKSANRALKEERNKAVKIAAFQAAKQARNNADASNARARAANARANAAEKAARESKSAANQAAANRARANANRAAANARATALAAVTAHLTSVMKGAIKNKIPPKGMGDLPQPRPANGNGNNKKLNVSATGGAVTFNPTITVSGGGNTAAILAQFMKTAPPSMNSVLLQHIKNALKNKGGSNLTGSNKKELMDQLIMLMEEREQLRAKTNNASKTRLAAVEIKIKTTKQLLKALGITMANNNIKPVIPKNKNNLNQALSITNRFSRLQKLYELYKKAKMDKDTAKMIRLMREIRVVIGKLYGSNVSTVNAYRNITNAERIVGRGAVSKNVNKNLSNALRILKNEAKQGGKRSGLRTTMKNYQPRTIRNYGPGPDRIPSAGFQQGPVLGPSAPPISISISNIGKVSNSGRVSNAGTGRLAVSAPTTNGTRQLGATSEQLIRGAGGAEAVEQGIKALNAANGNVARAKAASKLPNNTFTNIYAMGGPVAAKRIVEQRRRRRSVGGARVGTGARGTPGKKKRVVRKPRKQYIKLTPYQFKRLTDHIKKNNLRKVLIKEITH